MYAHQLKIPQDIGSSLKKVKLRLRPSSFHSSNHCRTSSMDSESLMPQSKCEYSATDKKDYRNSGSSFVGRPQSNSISSSSSNLS